jgi:Protein kinase domain
MEEDGKTLPDFDPKIPDAAGFSPPKRNIGAAAQTPPPPSASDAPTMVPGSAVPSGGAVASPVPSFVASSSLPLLFQPGMVIGGRYRILRILGEGGMGAVYQARDQELERIIALKVIRPELAGNASILQRFKQELILARHVTHKNVIRIYDMGEADGIKFITMEYVEGEDLRGLLRRQTKLAPSEAVEIIIQICRALDCAKRDARPEWPDRGHGFRSGTVARVTGNDSDRGAGGHPGIYVAGTGDGWRARPAIGSICGGIDFLRTAHGQGSLQGGDRDRKPDEANAGARCSRVRCR